MTGKVHSAVGIAAATLIMQPRDLNELLFCTAVGSIGGLLPDIDIRNSEIRQDLKELGVCAGVAGAFLVIYVCAKRINPLEFLKGLEPLKIVALLCLVCTILAGFLSSHRKFTHSIEFALLVSGAVLVISGDVLVGIGVLIGIVSHDLIDTLNKKKVLLSCIGKIQFCFNICAADSKMAKVIGIVSTALVIIYCFIVGIL